jgi:hypothetical protein
LVLLAKCLSDFRCILTTVVNRCFLEGQEIESCEVWLGPYSRQHSIEAEAELDVPGTDTHSCSITPSASWAHKIAREEIAMWVVGVVGLLPLP